MTRSAQPHTQLVIEVYHNTPSTNQMMSNGEKYKNKLKSNNSYRQIYSRYHCWIIQVDLDVCRYVSDIGTAIEAGMQAAGMKYLVIADCLIRSMFMSSTKA